MEKRSPRQGLLKSRSKAFVVKQNSGLRKLGCPDTSGRGDGSALVQLSRAGDSVAAPLVGESDRDDEVVAVAVAVAVLDGVALGVVPAPAATQSLALGELQPDTAHRNTSDSTAVAEGMPARVAASALPRAVYTRTGPGAPLAPDSLHSRALSASASDGAGEAPASPPSQTTVTAPQGARRGAQQSG